MLHLVLSRWGRVVHGVAPRLTEWVRPELRRDRQPRGVERRVVHRLLSPGLLLRWVPPTSVRSATSVSTAYFPRSATSVSIAYPLPRLLLWWVYLYLYSLPLVCFLVSISITAPPTSHEVGIKVFYMRSSEILAKHSWHSSMENLGSITGIIQGS